MRVCLKRFDSNIWVHSMSVDSDRHSIWDKIQRLLNWMLRQITYRILSPGIKLFKKVIRFLGSKNIYLFHYFSLFIITFKTGSYHRFTKRRKIQNLSEILWFSLSLFGLTSIEHAHSSEFGLLMEFSC